MGRITSYDQNGRMVADFDKSAYDLMAGSRPVDIGGIEVVSTGSRLLAAEDVAKVTTHVERLETENAKLRELANGYEALTATLCNERECDGCPFDDPEQIVCEHMRLQTCLAELEIEMTS